MCVCGHREEGASIANTLPKGPLLFSLSSGLKSHFNEYRVTLNGKSIMAIKAGGFIHSQRGLAGWNNRMDPSSLLYFVETLAACAEISQQLLDEVSGNAVILRR